MPSSLFMFTQAYIILCRVLSYSIPQSNFTSVVRNFVYRTLLIYLYLPDCEQHIFLCVLLSLYSLKTVLLLSPLLIRFYLYMFRSITKPSKLFIVVRTYFRTKVVKCLQLCASSLFAYFHF